MLVYLLVCSLSCFEPLYLRDLIRNDVSNLLAHRDIANSSQLRSYYRGAVLENSS